MANTDPHEIVRARERQSPQAYAAGVRTDLIEPTVFISAHAPPRYRSQVRAVGRPKKHAVRVGYFPPLHAFWSARPGGSSPAATIHKAYARALWRDRSWSDRLPIVAEILLWPVVVGALALWALSRGGVRVRREHGIALLSQLTQQFALAARFGILPPWYYMFELYDPARRALAANYLHRFEMKGGLYKLLRRPDVGVPPDATSNKVLFADWCQHNGLPHPRLLLVFHRGALTWCAEADGGLPPIDIFAKPLNGRGGHGAERWDYAGDGRYRDPSGRTMTSPQLIQHFAELSRPKGYLVQARMTNHPAIADLSNGALTTVRIMTIRNEREEFEPTDAVIRMARGANHTVDNFHAGGLAARVDIATGIIGPATDMGLRPTSAWLETHPDTGVAIAGRRVPMWDEILALAVRAHRTFCDRVAIGWDIAPLADGPCLIEGNGSPDVDILQRVAGEGLCARRFGILLAFHIVNSVILSGLL